MGNTFPIGGGALSSIPSRFTPGTIGASRPWKNTRMPSRSTPGTYGLRRTGYAAANARANCSTMIDRRMQRSESRPISTGSRLAVLPGRTVQSSSPSRCPSGGRTVPFRSAPGMNDASLREAQHPVRDAKLEAVGLPGLPNHYAIAPTSLLAVMWRRQTE
jgi:hypothetical protein